MKVKGYLVAIEIEKAFDSPDHNFLVIALEKFQFGKTSIDRTKTFLHEQELCVINGGINTKYLQLGKGG